MWWRRIVARLALVISAALAVAACGTDAVPSTTTETATTTTGPKGVTLTASTTTWETYAYELTRFGTILSGSYDGRTRTERTFDTWVLENEYLMVTLLPEFGGRILSIVYKPTGHEQLYQNPVGVPYQIDTNVFFFNWLMVYGGIFPTFPEPEHGKAWFAPWDFEIIEDSTDSVTVAMSFADDADYPFVPPQYRGAATGLELTYLVTLASGRSAVDVEVVIENPTGESLSFEYWTNVTLAPGSEPGNTRTTADAEIIAPIDLIEIPPFWARIAAEEEPAGPPDVYRFDRLRRFENWSDRGIAYAFPDVGDGDYWGVIDRASTEGLFRIADNSITPGLKLWTWGYPQTVSVDPHAGPNEARPYIELWAGLTREFFEKTEIEPGGVIRFAETYAPTIGLGDVTHANPDLLADVRVQAGSAIVDLFGLEPGSAVSALLTLDGTAIFEGAFTFDSARPSSFTAALPGPATGVLRLELTDAAGTVVLDATVDLDNE